MIHFIGDGGHAKVCRELCYRMKRSFDTKVNHWFVAVGNNEHRKEEALAQGAGPWATLVHKRATISPSASIDYGSVVMEGAIIQAGARIGRHVIVNAGAVITHDCLVEDYAHIAPGAHLCGNVHVGEGALVGVGVGIEPGVKIPAWSIVKRSPYEITIRGN